MRISMKATTLLSMAALVLLLPIRLLSDEPTATKDVQWVMTLGCRHCNFSELTGIATCKGNCGPAGLKDGKVYMFSGTAVPKDFKKGGKWLVKGTLSADGKDIAVKEMTFQTPTAEELKDDQPPKLAPDAKPYSGVVAHTGAGLPTLTGADKIRYALKPSKTATVAVRHTLTQIGGGNLTGTFKATGATYEDDTNKWIVVDAIQLLEAAAGQSNTAK